jgi:NADH-quinone oxidoreductase subunit H
MLYAIAVVAVLMIGLFLLGSGEDKTAAEEEEEAEREPFDAFAGGYPVPPMPGQAPAGHPVSTMSTTSPGSSPATRQES